MPLPVLFRRLFAAMLAVGLLAASVVAVLLAVPVAPPQRVPLFPRGRGEARALPLASEGSGTSSDSSAVLRAALVTDRVEELLRSQRLALLLGPTAGRTRLLGAQLRLRGSECSWDSLEELLLAEETTVWFERAQACRAEERSGAAEIALVVRSLGGVTLGILAPGDGARILPHYLRVREGGSESAVARVFTVEPSGGLSRPRVGLLAYMWQGGPSGIWAALGASVLLAVVGALLFPWRQPLPGPTEAGPGPALLASSGSAVWPFVARTGLGMGLFAWALTLAYATLVPPLAGLDEPYHLRSYAGLAKQPELEGEVQRWAELTHVTRIRFQPGQKFRYVDVESPLHGRDPFSFTPDVRARSAATAAFWGSLAPLLERAPAPRTLLRLRLANGLLFGFVLGLAAAFLAASAPARWPQLLATPLLLVPSLPFFATALSELALLTSAAILFAAALVALFLDGPRASWAGLPLGLGAALLFAGGRSPWPLVALLAAVLLARILLGPRDRARPAREAGLFWGGLGLGLAVFFTLADDAYVGGVSSDRIAAIAPRGLGALAILVVRSPLPALALLVSSAVLEVRLTPLRPRLARRLAAAWRRAWRTGALVVAVLVGLSLLASLVVRYPSLPLVPIPNPYPRAEYAARALAVMVTELRLSEPDFLTFSSFWGGFGWSDTIPPRLFLTGLVLVLATALVGLLLYLRRCDDSRPPAFLLAFALGAAASVVLYALAIHRLPMNLTGRYMVGWHVAFAAVAGSLPALADDGPWPFWLPRKLGLVARTSWLLLAAGALHAYCLRFILQRYF